MPFLGNQPVEGYKTTAKQTITGDGSSSYALDNKVTSASDLEVFINNVRQEPGVDYTASGNTITFTTAVTSSDSCWLVYQGKAATTTTVGTDNIADGSVTSAKIAAGTIPDAITKSATAPSNPSNGDMWYDTDDYALRLYDGAEWQLVKSAFSATGGTYSEVNGYAVHTFTSSGTFEVTKGVTLVEYIIVAGGGGGGTAASSNNRAGGGGGAGGYLTGTASVSMGTYSIVIGGGGAGSSGYYTVGNSGGNSSAVGITALGGGRGGTGNGTAGASGGSGGGGGAGNNTSQGGSGTAGQGNAGGNVSTAANSTNGYSGGGGGGASGAGDSAIPGVGAIVYGGAGITDNWTGSSVERSRGGNRQSGTTPPNDGPANTGNGGKSGGASSYAGGSGIVIIRYAI